MIETLVGDSRVRQGTDAKGSAFNSASISQHLLWRASDKGVCSDCHAPACAALGLAAQRRATRAPGALAGKAEVVAAVRSMHNVLGGVIDPHAASLLLRGMKTLGLRVAAQNCTAMEVRRLGPARASVGLPGLGGGGILRAAAAAPGGRRAPPGRLGPRLGV